MTELIKPDGLTVPRSPMRRRSLLAAMGGAAAVPMLTEPTSAQREAFDLVGVPIPLTLK